jgi:hypothetical protein
MNEGRFTFRKIIPLVIFIALVVVIHIFFQEPTREGDHGDFSFHVTGIEKIIFGVVAIICLAIGAYRYIKNDFNTLLGDSDNQKDEKVSQNNEKEKNASSQSEKKMRSSNRDVVISKSKAMTPRRLATILQGVPATERPEIAKYLENRHIFFDGRVSQIESIGRSKLRISSNKEGFTFTFEVSTNKQSWLNSLKIKDKIRVAGFINFIEGEKAFLCNVILKDLSQ